MWIEGACRRHGVVYGFDADTERLPSTRCPECGTILEWTPIPEPENAA